MAGRRLAAFWPVAVVLSLASMPGCGDSRPTPAPNAGGLSAVAGLGGSGAAASGNAGSGINTGGTITALPGAGSAGIPSQAPSGLSGRPLAILADPGGSGCADYYPEILRTEGISSFERLPLSGLASLSQYAVALLPGTALSDAQAAAIASWVEQGGRLISLRPDSKLEPLLGIAAKHASLSEGYFEVDAARWGIASGPLQFHGDADLRAALPGTRAEGRLLDAERSEQDVPVLTVREGIGPGAGKAAALAFDLACSVILTRQGNPAQAGRTALDSVPRSSELFASFLDTQNFEIPQADEQQRLLVRLLHELSADRVPLPRLWYLPGGRKLAVVMTGDDHNSNGTAAFFDTLKSPTHSPAGCSAQNWSCARATSWVYSNVGALKNGTAAQLTTDGFEIGPHVAMDRDGGCATWSSDSDLLARFTARRSEFQADYGIPPSTTNRSHCFVFADWDSHPKVEAQLGIRLDENYTPYALPGTQNRLGRLNGSAMPMRFTDAQGAVLDIYQLVSDMDYEYFDAGTTPAELSAAIGKLFDGALGPRELVGFVGTHYDYSGGLEASFRTELLKQIAERGADRVAMISARQLLDWLDLRNSSSFDALSFDGSHAAFTLELPPDKPNPGLEVMLPTQFSGGALSAIERDGAPVPILRFEEVRTVQYAFFEAASGRYRATYR